MRYYIVNEVTIALKKKGTYIYAAGIIILSLLANIAMVAFRSIYGMREGAFGANLIYFAQWCFIVPYYSTILIAEIIFGKECPNPKIRNKVTIGLSRAKLYFGKLLSELSISAVFLVAAIFCFIGITYIFMAADGSIEIWVVQDFCRAAATAIPLWITGIAIGNGLLFFFPRKRYAFVTFFGLLIALPRIIMFFAAEPFQLKFCQWLKEYLLLTPRFNELPYYATLNMPKIMILSSIYTLSFTALGLWAYYKKEY
ncbi:MAG: hypothetical protein HDR22_02940 [Lachnospiraceae bacterium]|nr:hypothetical protein [Lachnospiraceae bacterium]